MNSDSEYTLHHVPSTALRLCQPQWPSGSPNDSGCPRLAGWPEALPRCLGFMGAECVRQWRVRAPQASQVVGFSTPLIQVAGYG